MQVELMLTIATVMSNYNIFLPRKWSINQMSEERIDVNSLYKATAFTTSTGPPAQDP
jgi:hypothetical protein